MGRPCIVRDKAWLMSHVEVAENGCWLWTGALHQHGYGLHEVQVNKKPKDKRAHRTAWELWNGPIPEATPCVLHNCPGGMDNPRCVNPDHLFLGTKKDNSMDMVRKGRHRTNPNYGEKHFRAVLTDSQAKEIYNRLKSGERVLDLSKEFKVGKHVVWCVASGLTYSTITGGEPINLLNGSGRVGRSVIMKVDVIAIRLRLRNGDTQSDIAKDYNINQATVSAISRRITWKWVEDSPDNNRVTSGPSEMALEQKE